MQTKRPLGITPTSDVPPTVAAAQQGEGWAFDALFETWNRPMTAFVAARGIRDVDDVVNEIFLGAFRSIGSFRGSEPAFRAWLFRIARNKIADEHRRSGRRPVTIPIEDRHADVAGGSVERDAEARMGRHRVDELLERLTDEQREVLVLRLIADLTIDQIAEITGRRRGAVKQLQRRGLRRLERLIDDDLSDDPYPSRRTQR